MGDIFTELSNAVRFPADHAVRPLMEHVCELEPDLREVQFAADSLSLDLPTSALRDRVDEEMARHIAEQVLPLAPAERRLALDVLLAPVVAGSLRACADAAWASGHCASARRDVEQARREGGHWMEPIEEWAEMLAREAGVLLVAAHLRCQEAHGVARAVGVARRGEVWTPRDAAETTAWLAECGAAQGA